MVGWVVWSVLGPGRPALEQIRNARDRAGRRPHGRAGRVRSGHADLVRSPVSHRLHYGTSRPVLSHLLWA